MPDKGSSSYREAWKASKEQQNSLVFNFVGAKKDVSHIENDGLDLSSRAKSQGKVRIASIEIISLKGICTLSCMIM